MKKFVAGVAVVVVLVAGGLWWLGSNLDGLIRDGIVTLGSEMTGAKVQLGAVRVDAQAGRVALEQLVVGNPPGFRTPHAVRVAHVGIEVDLGTITQDVVLVRSIEVVAPDLIYEKGDTQTNVDAIQANVRRYVGPARKDAGSEPGGKKLIVGQFVIRDAKAQASAAFMEGKTVSVPLPDIRLRDIGKAKGGVTPGELGQAITDALKARLANAVSFDRLMKSAGKALKDAGDAVKNLFK